MKLHVIRHGEVNPNLNHIIASYTDENLNENGIKQANESREEVSKLDYDLLICSPMKRTCQTASIINSKNVQVIYDERIIERNAGVYENRKSSELDKSVYWNYYTGDSVENVEKISSLFKRVYDFLEDVKVRYKDKNILVVTHSGVCRAIACYFKGIPKDGDLAIYRQKNCEIKSYEF